MATRLGPQVEDRLKALARTLVDDSAARIVREPTSNAPGFWFGSGGIARDADGAYYICGRYRDQGDSRTGVGAGRRGWKLVVTRGADPGAEFEEIWSAEKSDLGTERGAVVSIEGSAIFRRDDGTVELYVSTEKDRAYPDLVASAQKPGTGIWDIDVVSAGSFDTFRADQLRPLIWSDDPTTLHIKDPSVSVTPAGETLLIFCHHGFNWSSSSTGTMLRQCGSDEWGSPSLKVL